MRSRALLRVTSPVVLLLACASVKKGGEPSGGGGASGGGGSSGGSAAGGASGHGGGSGSGGSSTGLGGSAGDVGTSDDAGGCGTLDFDLHSGPANVLLVQDRSGSMKDVPKGQTQTKWALTTAAVTAVAMQTDTSVSWGLKTFPEGLTQCLVTSTIDLPIAPMNAANLATAIGATTPDGNGTPTGDAILAAFNYMKTLTLPGQRFMVLSTDGDPNCGSDTVTQLANAASMGIKTFVIGIGTSSSSPANLNAMAVAGGEARPQLSPLDTKYYPADSQDQLSMQLALITGQVISCTFDFQMAPPLTNGVHVTVNGTEIYDDPTHTSGWDYTDMTYKQIQLYGPPCQQIQAGNNQIHILFDCKPVIVP
jgi:hypothetical protein